MFYKLGCQELMDVLGLDRMKAESVPSGYLKEHAAAVATAEQRGRELQCRSMGGNFVAPSTNLVPTVIFILDTHATASMSTS